ncbi:MAG: DNA-processing protein DprA [Chitinophagaceae bacterium]
MKTDLLYQLALTLVPNIGPVQAKLLLQHCEPEEIFHARKHFLEKIEGIGPVRAASIKKFTGFGRAEQEIAFIEKYRIKPLFLTDKGYPKRLLNCYDSPTLLYYRGEADLNAARIISIIGTRSHTDYAKQVTDKLVKELSDRQVIIVSGLAYGVDALAHKSSVKNGIPTVGVLAHGLDQVYPPDHTGLAKDMIKQGGGLLTEFRSKTKPDKHNFPSRNRIVAGMSDATLVIETDLKGGSMITAELANGYNKDVFAIPGKINESKSAGCNYLIRSSKAQLITSAADICDIMGWNDRKTGKATGKPQKTLFIELTPDERTVIGMLKDNEQVHIDEINLQSGLSSGKVAAAILNLELQNVIVSLPGKMYRLT